MLNMSFFKTTEQIRNRTKFVTRRVVNKGKTPLSGWARLLPGEIVQACVKCQGLRSGEKIEKLCKIAIESIRTERLDAITAQDVIDEGFPELTPSGFVEMFCKEMRCKPDDLVYRIAFDYV